MPNLIRLEMKKYKLVSYVKGAIIANVIIAGLFIALLFVSNYEKELMFNNYTEALSAIETLVRATFIIFAATLISKLIISEFKDKTITTLFLYPVNRKKLIAAKLAIVIVFTFCSITLSNLFLTAVFSIVTTYFDLVPGSLTVAIVTQHAPFVLMNAVAASGMSLIPLYFGMKKFSVSTTIISSVLIVLIISSNSGNFSLNDILIIPISLAIIGISIAYFAIRNIEKTDLKC